jgi:GT2 family glycosyltransferase
VSTGALSASLCLCTYNGERYLGELLESLVEQSRRPDEVVVCDDASTDSTPALLARFATEAPFPVRVRRNTETLGIVRNFEQAVLLAARDVVFLCDQDDRWDRRKIEVVMGRMEGPDAPVAALHDSALVDASGRALGGTLWGLLGFGELERERFEAGAALDYLVCRALAAGHALAFSATARSLLVPFSTYANYDTWIAQLLSATGPIALVDETLVEYRLHQGNSIGLRGRQSISHLLSDSGSASQRFGRVAAGLLDLEARLDERAPGSLTTEARRRLHARAAHLGGRAALASGATPLAALSGVAAWIVGEVRSGNYSSYSNGLRSVAYDTLGVARRLWTSRRRTGRSDADDAREVADPASHPRATPLSPRPSVTAIVVEYRSGPHLATCVSSLQRCGTEVVVVDNGSPPEGSSAPPGFSDVNWLAAPDNPGFGGGINRGAALCDTELMLICNPDIVLEDDALALLCTALVADDTAAAVGPALVDAAGRVSQSARAFPSLRSSWRQAFLGLLHPAGRRSSEYRARNWALAERGVVDWVTGACVLVRTDAFRAVGGFDEGFFLYVEEVDLCWRLRRAGWKVLYEPKARVLHRGAVSTSSHPYRAIIVHHRSLWRFARKTTAGIDRALLPPAALAIAGRCAVACLLRLRRGTRSGRQRC